MHKKLLRTTVLAWLFAATIVGLAVAPLGAGLGQNWWALPLVTLMILAAIRRSRLACVVGVMAAMALGVMQGGAFIRSVALYKSFTGRLVQVEGSIREDPTYGSKANKQLAIDDISLLASGRRYHVNGAVFVSTLSSPDVTRHDRVQVSGKLKEGFGPFQASMSFAQITVVAHEQNYFDKLRSRFAAAVTAVLPEPHASLGLGFVIGMKSSLPSDFSMALQELSLTHAVVASGYNLTVLVRLAKRLRRGQSRLQTLLLSLLMIGAFIMVTGTNPSMVRAGLVSGFSMVAWFYGRRMKPLVVLLFVMALTAFVYPPFLWGDIGYWLSFGAFAGILLVVPLLHTTFWPSRSPPAVMQIALEALVSELITLPIILIFFSKLSLLGLVANMLVVPLIPLAMLLVAAAGLTDMVAPAIAPWIALPAHGVLALIVWIIQRMSAVPWAAVDVHIGVAALIVWYAIMALTTALAWRRLSAEKRREALARQIV